MEIEGREPAREIVEAGELLLAPGQQLTNSLERIPGFLLRLKQCSRDVALHPQTTQIVHRRHPTRLESSLQSEAVHHPVSLLLPVAS